MTSFHRYRTLRYGLPSDWRWRSVVSLTLLFVLSFSAVSNGQPPLGLMPNQDIGANGIPPGLRPDAVYMKNEAGDTVLVPRLRYEEFERYLQSSTEGTLDSNAIGIDSLALDVRIENSIARIQGNIGAVLREPNKKWLAVPVALGNVQMIPKVLDPASDDSRMGIGVNGNGYVWRIPPGPSGSRSSAFEAVANVAISSQGNSLRLDLPNAPSIVRFYIPVSDWELTVNGMGSEVIEPIPGSTPETSHYLVRVSGGTLSATWTRRASSDLVQATEAVSSNKYTSTNNPDLFAVNTTIVLRGPKSLGGRRFLLTLPPGSDWRESNVTPPLFSNFKITRRDSTSEPTTANPADANATPPASNEKSSSPNTPSPDKPPSEKNTTLSIDIDEAMSATELEVSIQWQSTLIKSDEFVEFPLPTIDGVQRHSGTVELAIPRSRILVWNPQPGITLQKQATSVIESADAATYSFRFATQPAAVRCKLYTPSATPQIRAEHRLMHQQDRIQLTTTIDFLEDPRSLAFLQLECQGWVVERASVLSTGRELSAASTGDSSGKVIVPLSVSDLLEIGESSSTVVSPTPSTSTGVEPVRNRRVSLQLSRRLANASDQSPQGSDESIVFLLPKISWLDESSSQRKSWCPQGKLTAQSTVSLLDFQQESTSFRTTGPDLEVARFDGGKDLGSQRLLPTANIRSTVEVWLRGEPEAIQCTVHTRALGTEIESNATVRIVATPEETRWEQDWLLQIRGVAPKLFHVAIPTRWLGGDIEKDAAGKDDAAAGNDLRQADLDINGVPLTDYRKCTEEELALLNRRYGTEWKKQVEWYAVAVPANVIANTPADSPWLVTIHSNEVPFSLDAKSTSRLQFPFACLDCVDAKVSLRTTNWSCLVQSPQHSKLMLNEASLEKTISEIQIGSERRMQARIAIPLDDPRIDATLVLTQPDSETKVYVDRVWVQSVVKTAELRHRFVIRFRTDRPTLVIRPPAELLADAEILLNGQSVSLEAEPSPNEGYRLDLTTVPDLNAVVPLADSLGVSPSPGQAAVGRHYVLEFFSWPSQQSSWVRKLSLPIAQIQGSNIGKASTVWQIVSSKSDHLLSTSQTLEPNYRWRWSDLWLAREDLWDQEGLERSMGASTQAPLGPQTNRYTLVSLTSAKEQYVYLLPKFLLWIPAALLSLLACYVALEFKWLRHPIAWVIAVSVILALSQLSFDATVVFSQAFVMATLVSVLFVVIRWAIDHRARRRSVFAGRSQFGSTLFPSRSDSKAERLSGSGVLLSQATTISPSQDVAKNIVPDAASSVGR